MLTKDHLKVRIKDGRAVPLLLKGDDAAALRAADEMLAAFEGASGQTLGDLEETTAALASTPVAAAFRKLLLDRCDTHDAEDSIEDRRWQWLLAAQNLRKAHAQRDDFAKAVADELGDVAALYADLPHCRRIDTYDPIPAPTLFALYNVGQVQGLLLTAREIVLTLAGATLAEKRFLFRQIRFHRLLAEVVVGDDDKSLVVRLDGPLSLFDHSPGYGLRLATFFPNVLALAKWKLEATVKVKQREVTLKLDEKSGLIDPRGRTTPHVPAELTSFVEAFNGRMSGSWNATPGEEFVHLGRQSYCFPDVTITSLKGAKIHLELFHKWHAGQLAGRLQALETSSVSNLRLGVAKELAKQEKVAASLQASSWFAKYGFLFSEFPTPKAVVPLLGQP